MNATAHRLIFNPTRGCLMAVAETSRSCGKSSASGASRSTRAKRTHRQCQPLPAPTTSDASICKKNRLVAQVEPAQSAITSGVFAVADQDSHILIQGSKLTAGQNATLNADGQVKLLAAQNTTEQHSTNQNNSASVGVGFTLGSKTGVSLTASAASARGNADGADHIASNSHVTAGHTANIQSGGDTTLQGAVIAANTVNADVGGKLNIESLSDTSQFDAKQSSAGAGVSLCIPPLCIGASSVNANAGKAKVNGDFASVTEQSGIRAGDGGFNVNVKDNTTLKGAAITSTEKAVADNKNSFNGNTAEGLSRVTTSDIQNHADFQASSLSLSTSGGGGGQQSGQAASTTTAAISNMAGNKAARTGDKETGIGQIFEADKVMADVNAQAQITQSFGSQASKAVGDYAGNKSKELNAQAKNTSDPTERKALLDEAAKWDEGGTYRSAAHAVIGGLTGGASGAAGAGAAALSADAINKATANLSPGVKNAVGAAIAAGIGAAAGGGNVTGVTAALNEDLNNRQLHLTEAQKLDALKQGKTKEQQERLNAAACAMVRCADGVPDSDPNKATLVAMQTQGANYAVEQGQLRATGEFVYRPLIDSASDLVTRNGETTQRVGGAVNLAGGSVGMVGGGVIAASGAASCVQTGGLGCAAAAVGVGVATLSNQQAQDGSKALLGPYTSTEGQRVLDSFSVQTYPGERDVLKDAGIDAATLGLVFVGGKYIPKALAGAEGLGTKATTTGPIVNGQMGNSQPINKIVYNGVELDSSLPPPVAGYDYAPTFVKGATTDNAAYAHLTGFQSEVKLANEVAGQGQAVVRWGDKIGTNGSDVVSVNPTTGAVTLWDSKYRSATTSMDQSPTFANAGTRSQAIREAQDAIDASNVPQSVKDIAKANLRDGNITTNTVGAGGVKNSVQVRYCGHNPC